MCGTVTYLYALPAWLLLLLIIAACAVLACAGNVVVHRSFPKTDFIAHNEVAGFIIAVVGVIYAVLLGFLTVIVWENFSQSQERAHQEVNAATDMARFARHLAPDEALRVRDDLGRYSAVIVADEWPQMQRGSSSARAQRLIVRLIDDVATLRTPSLQQSNLQNHLLERVQTMADLRRRRISDNGSGVPSVMWLALIIGACTVIGFVYLFGLENFTVHLLMTAACAITIGLAFGLIVVLDYPFRGDVSVSPERWIALDESLAAEIVSGPHKLRGQRVQTRASIRPAH